MAATDVSPPCGWDVDTSCCPEWEDATPAQQERAAGLAIRGLWMATGRMMGRCVSAVRPCRRGCGPDGSWWGNRWSPRLDAGQWINVSCCDRGGHCGCSAIPEIPLPGYLPEPISVRVNGRFLPVSAYEVHNGRYLVRVDGGSWPVCQDLTRRPDQTGTFEVRMTSGVPIDAQARAIAGIYACEWLKHCMGLEGCDLSARATNVSRQGVTFDLGEIEGALEDGLTGLPEVDTWIRQVNPFHVKQPTTVMSPDLVGSRVVTWP